MKSIARIIFRTLCKLYPKENGKYTLLQKIYFPYLAPKTSTEIETTIIDNIKMKLNITEYIQAYLYNFGSYELPTINYIKKNIKPNMTILDIGGNVGLMTLVFANQLKKTGKVFTFEPEPNNFSKLQHNIKLNEFSNIVLNQVAVSDSNSVLKFFLSTGNNFGVHSLIYNEDLDQNFIEVPTVKIDDFVLKNNISKVDMIKIDVEGAELDVINGMRDLLKRDKPILILEVVSKYLKSRGLSSSEFKRTMNAEFGYTPYTPNVNGELLKESFENENIGDNVIFI